MTPTEVEHLARVFRETYSPQALDALYGVGAPTVELDEGGSRSLTLPRAQIWEPLRSMQLIDANALGQVLVVAFTWGLLPEEDDGTVYVMHLDTRGRHVDLHDRVAVASLLSNFLEFSLGGPKESWLHRCTPLGDRLAVVRPWDSSAGDPAPC